MTTVRASKSTIAREQCRVCLTICDAGGIFCETMGGGVHRDTETLTLSAAQTHTANVMGV